MTKLTWRREIWEIRPRDNSNDFEVWLIESTRAKVCVRRCSSLDAAFAECEARGVKREWFVETSQGVHVATGRPGLTAAARKRHGWRS